MIQLARADIGIKIEIAYGNGNDRSHLIFFNHPLTELICQSAKQRPYFFFRRKVVVERR